MDPLEQLSSTPRQNSAEDTAPAAAAWLRNPEPVEQKLTCAQRLMLDLQQNGEWKGAPYGTPENPAR